MKDSTRREALMHSEIITLSYCFWDIYDCAPKLFQKAVDLMTNEELEKFIDDNLSLWEHGIEAGLCTDQGAVLSTCAMDSMNMPGVFGRQSLDDARKGIHPCLNCEDKIIDDASNECEAKNYCVAIAAYTDFVTAKELASKLLFKKNVYRNHILGQCQCNSGERCIALRYVSNEIGPEEVIRLLSDKEEVVDSEKVQ